MLYVLEYLMTQVTWSWCWLVDISHRLWPFHYHAFQLIFPSVYVLIKFYKTFICQTKNVCILATKTCRHNVMMRLRYPKGMNKSIKKLSLHENHQKPMAWHVIIQLLHCAITRFNPHPSCMALFSFRHNRMLDRHWNMHAPFWHAWMNESSVTQVF